MNSDGVPDLLYGDELGFVHHCSGIDQGDTVPLLTSEGYIQVASSPMDVGLRASPFPVDWNSDGLTDILIGNYDGEIRIYVNSGTPENYQYDGYELVEITGIPIDLSNTGPLMIDMTGDGLKDLMIGYHYSSSETRICFSANVGTALQPLFLESEDLYYDWGLQPITEFLYSYPYVADYDSDGVPDLILGTYYGTVYVYINTATGIEHPETEVLSTGFDILQNPVRSTLILRVTSPVGITGKLFDASGRCVSSFQVAGGPDTETLVDVSNLPVGVYSVVAEPDDGPPMNQRFTILR